MKWVVDYLYPKNYDLAAIPDLSGKVILVTGGCSGLGFEIASHCAAQNATKVILLSYPSPRLDNAVKSISTKMSALQGARFLEEAHHQVKSFRSNAILAS
jgi:NAD(P)-dependent dehydrogenase (short-subunit alcohol dehydrogenase family)